MFSVIQLLICPARLFNYDVAYYDVTWDVYECVNILYSVAQAASYEANLMWSQLDFKEFAPLGIAIIDNICKLSNCDKTMLQKVKLGSYDVAWCIVTLGIVEPPLRPPCLSFSGKG